MGGLLPQFCGFWRFSRISSSVPRKKKIWHTIVRSSPSPHKYMLWTSKTHIISIWSWIGLSNHCHHARWQNFTVSSPKFPILPQGELSVCRFPVTLGGIVGLLRTNVTPSSYGQLQNLSIKAYSLEHHIWGYTSPLPTADVFLLIRHFSANATNTPSSRVISCSFWRQRVLI